MRAPPNGDAEVDANDAGFPVGAPSIPWLAEATPPIAAPMLTPCPEGWCEVVEEAPEGGAPVVTCDPYGTDAGGTELDACPAGSAHFVGEAECAAVGAPCPAGNFPERLPSDAEVLYVLSSALPGGDGSEGSPLSTITGALNLASAGTVIAIGKGDYDEAVRLRAGVTLWGACAAETRLTASSPGPLAQGVITAPAANTQLTNLRIGPANLPGLVAFGAGASVWVDGLVIEGVRLFGLHALRGARVHGRELSVAGTQADSAGALGRGIAARSGGHVELARVSVSRNRDVGVFADGEGTSVTLTDAVVRDTQSQESDRAFGRGLTVQAGATMEVTRALISRSRDIGVYSEGTGTSLSLSDVVIRDTQAQERDGMGGRGLSVQQGARADVTRVVLARNRDLGVYASGDGTSVALSDVVIRNTLERASDGTGGRGLTVQFGARAEVTRTWLSGNRDVGVQVSGLETAVTLSDLSVRYTRRRESDETHGRGLNVQGGATVTVNGALLSHNRETAVTATGEGTSVTASDVVIRETREQQAMAPVAGA